MGGPASVRILGSRVHDVLVPEALETMRGWVRAHRAGQHARPRFVVASGFHGLYEAHRDPSFRAATSAADLWLPDGIAAVWAARWHRRRLRGRAPGPDLLHGYLAASAAHGGRSFFHGGTQKVLDALVARVEAAHPRHEVAGAWSPPFRPLRDEEEAADVARINAARPDVLWIGLGLPKQERWIHRNLARLDVPVVVGVGAAFAFEAGVVARAPRWMGRMGLEWLHRLAQEPRRMWRRVFRDAPRFLLALLAEPRARAPDSRVGAASGVDDPAADAQSGGAPPGERDR